MATKEQLKAQQAARKAEREAQKAAPGESPTLLASLERYRQALDSRTEKAQVRELERQLHEFRGILDTLAEFSSAPLRPVARREFGSGVREATAVILASDWHVEEPVRAEETPLGNVYNLDVAERSIGRFFDGAKWLIDMHRSKWAVRDVVLWLGGDLMSGHIHEELKINTAMSPIPTILWLRDRLISGIDAMLADPRTESIRVPCSYGNHGRTTLKPMRALGAEHSYEWLLYQILADHYRSEPRIQFLADKSAHQYLTVYDYNLHFHHGDEANYGGGVGGITIPLNKATAQWDQAARCDYHNFGHWHQYTDTGRIAVNGSMIGYNAYAMSIKASPEVPAQSFFLVDSKRGKTCKSPIWVRE